MAEHEVGLNGADILLYVDVDGQGDYQPLAGQRGATRELNAATIDISHKLDKHERFLPGRLSSTMSFDGLWVPDDAAYIALENARENQETIVARLLRDGEPWKEADGFLTSLSESHGDQEASTVSASFQVSGAWRDVEESS
jgi:TP901-1 family phage major tail protein